MLEKTDLPTTITSTVVAPSGTADAPSPRKLSRRAGFCLTLGVTWLLLVFLNSPSSTHKPSHRSHGCHGSSYKNQHWTAADLSAAKCPTQPPARNIGIDWNPLHDSSYAQLAARRLSQAVQIKTESFDDLSLDPTDPSWDKHNAFAHMMEVEFPKVYDSLSHSVVNTHGHLFEWRGKNESLKPVVLMAHIDTVPVLPATLDQWTFPPFEGKISVNGTSTTPGTWIWGRGASDCKNSVMGILGSVERLVTEGYTPDRTVILAFGFDEEISGYRGAAHLAKAVTEKYGEKSVAFIVDEGFSGLSHEYGSLVFSLGMAEKGSLDVVLKVEMPGGHSSVPPPHTAIGIISKIITTLESHPPEPVLNPHNPLLGYLTCMADHAPEFPKDLKKQVKNPKKWKMLARELAAKSRYMNSFLATTQAVDLINGGVKVNALPEVVTAVVNHRISFTSSVAETKERLVSLVKPLARKMDFTFSAFDSHADSSSRHNNTKSAYHISISQRSIEGLEPAPITSSSGKSFGFMASTSKAVFGDEVIVVPTGMYANTDTRHYWNLTSNIYRVTPALVTETLNVHTVDERISLNAHLNTTRFYYKLLRNLEGWTD